MIRRALSRHSTIVQAGVFVCALSLMLLARLDAREVNSMYVPPRGSVYRLPNAEFARFATLGYHEAAADLAWLRTIIYYGEEATVRGRFEHFDSYANLVIALDPQFHRIYQWAGVLSIYSRAVITREVIESSIDFLGRGTERFPMDGEMHYMLGFNLYFEYPPHLAGDEKAIRKAKLEGIEHLKAAVVSGTGPTWLPNMVAGLMTKQGMNELAINSLYESLAVVEDPETRAKIFERIDELEASAAGSSQTHSMRAFQREWTETYRYLSMDMFMLLRPRPLFPPEASIEPVFESDDALEVLDTLDVDS
ncbi:MAG: hypothetical protein JRG91_10285 [Deltaproteobacteria bacterium]|nr:hypothetical protein [Deltaproteobacteria bacterium]